MALLGERLCMKRELQEISLTRFRSTTDSTLIASVASPCSKTVTTELFLKFSKDPSPNQTSAKLFAPSLQIVL
ncbi:hypothetical protein DEO72_LG8g77 [Vigna unguiculata]|uniref:Uncharacterized protein n=1 Tax=Vigna unguiculata TaxID=3917 RepID=A0A4D6MKQ6_VIGUN|nr:hypothetical protein DEO72_LG8g77 [Vigna unguiculata]